MLPTQHVLWLLLHSALIDSNVSGEIDISAVMMNYSHLLIVDAVLFPLFCIAESFLLSNTTVAELEISQCDNKSYVIFLRNKKNKLSNKM